MPVIVNVIHADQPGTITGMICDYAGPKGEVIFDHRHNEYSVCKRSFRCSPSTR
jgi:hypothetical protein